MQLKTILTPLYVTLARRILCTTFVLSTLGGSAVAQEPSDRAIFEMQRAARTNDKARLSSLLPQARGHVLEPWAAYWELKARLLTASADEVQDFFKRYANSYQEDRLRNDWLLMLGRAREWKTFKEVYPGYRMGDDKEVRCYASAAGDETLDSEVRDNWFTLKEVDDGCTLAASRLIDAGRMPPSDAWRKARIAMENNRPAVARKAIELVAPEATLQLGEISASPMRYLSAQNNLSMPIQKELALLAVIRLASGNPELAATQMFGSLNEQLQRDQANWAWGVITKEAVLKPDTGAATYARKITEDNDLSDDLLGWKTRALIRLEHPEWPAVVSAIDAMSIENQLEPTWAYWKARALRAQKTKPEISTALLESIASMQGFYEQLALEELGRSPSVPPKPAPLTTEEVNAVNANPGLIRALTAMQMGLKAEGVREWNYTTNLVNNKGEAGGMGDRELYAAAQLACVREIWDRCINTSERTLGFIDAEQRFPMPFKQFVLQRSGDARIDAAYVYGLMRQESRFVTEARSGVGASGLMQIMPATARWTARKIGLSGFNPSQLSDQDTNIMIGTAYLKLVLDDFGGSMAMAAAAYNAGPGRPRSWRNGPTVEAAAWIENIPFHETRDYVKKVIANTVNYSALLTGQPQPIKAKIGSIGTRDGFTVVDDKELP